MSHLKPIFKIGAEIEGLWENRPSGFKDDGSVSFDGRGGSDDCNGSCRDECECYCDCTCDECSQCTSCENAPDSCDCDSCLICDGCECNFEDCECKIDRCEKCKNKDYPCDKCDENFHDNQNLSRNCSVMSNLSYNCEQECNCECGCECNCNSDGSYVGEIASQAFENINDLIEYMDKNYPGETNSTCGLHIHISVNDKRQYSQLMDKEFNKYFLNQVLKFGKYMKINKNSQFYKRLQNENHYCKVEFIPNDQIKNISRDENRYRHLNYCYNLENCGNKMKTLECRLFPAFNKKYLALEAIRFYYEIVTAYLNRKHREVTHKLSLNQDINEEITREEIEICV